MARKKKDEELPELPLSLNEEEFKSLTGVELLDLIQWIERRKKQVIKADIAKLKEEEESISKKQDTLHADEQTLAIERTRVQEELSQFEEDNKQAEELEKVFNKASEKIKALTKQKKISKEKIDELKNKNPQLFEIRTRLHKIEKEEESLAVRKEEFTAAIQSNKSSQDKLQKIADAYKKEEEIKQAKLNVKRQEKLVKASQANK